MFARFPMLALDGDYSGTSKIEQRSDHRPLDLVIGMVVCILWSDNLGSTASGLLCTLLLEDRDDKGENETFNLPV